MELVYWWKTAFRKYADFEGRASRSEFWYFYLGNFLLMIATSIVDRVIDPNYWLLSSLLSLALLIPRIATSIRRLHDINRSGWNFLWIFLPVIGWIILFVFYVTKSDPVENRFGMPPTPLMVNSLI